MNGAFISMLKNIIIFVLLAIPGYILVKTKLLKQENSGVLSKVLTWVGMPFLILSSTLGITFNADTIVALSICGVLGVAFLLGQFFLSIPLSTIEKDKKSKGMMRFCEVFANNGFLGLPLAMAVFGSASKVVLYLSLLNILSNIFMYTLGVYLVSGDKKTINIKKALANPVLIAFIIGIVLNLIKATNYIPEINTYSNHLKGLVTPLSMLVLGMKLGGIKVSSLFVSWKMYYVSAIKLIVFPVLIVAAMFLFKFAFAIDIDMIYGMFIAFAVPTAGLAPAFADEYDSDSKNAVVYTLGTTILSTLTIPLLYWIIVLLV